ncbi:hypothetical protein BDP81DRAFT_305611 [Colletotrichum phormii]|uniref:Uncharacterized protein n=1 Tax=Colletotrichum phormii TaxID=359342 RepID=A0AAJ0EM35_9PEZI|nr:uncharacterized protein BDP81DRAFT_305611 [Colletotrichum phormii]KAK1656192.1 hypothetical protein BDP81DRAFT_305611 [Colletotrichum phormii]
MRRHNSAKSRSTLTRSKSTASVCSAIQRLEHIDPDTAKRDAHIAATLSFSRANPNIDMGMGLETSRQCQRSVNMETWPENPSSPPQSEFKQLGHNDGGLRRQQSVRFVKQESRTKRQQSQSNDDSSDLGTIRHRGVLTDVVNQPASRISRPIERPFVSTYTTNYINSLPPSESFVSPDECAPAPASYRRLRKSRSMLSPLNPTGLRRPSKIYLSESPEQENVQPALRRQSMQDMKDSKPPPKKTLGLRNPKSMSFLKIRSVLESDRIGSRQQIDLAVQEAEDSFRKDIEEQRHLKPRPSTIFSKAKKGQASLSLRRSMRDFSADVRSLGAEDSLAVNKDASLRKKARKVSSSFKTKLKEMFRRNKKDDLVVTASKPQLEASNAVHGLIGDDNEQDDAYMDITDPVLLDECSISQVPSRVPSLHDATSTQKLRSRQGSIESIGSERKASDEKSRVTSWTSSGTHTLNSQSTWGGERERQRLSIIKEIGPHKSSSSFQRPSLADRNPFETVTQSTPQDGPARPGPPVDSARVYSALMKRLKECKQNGQREEQLRHSSVGSTGLKAYGTIDLSNSIGGQELEEARNQDPPTIRCVLQEDDVFRDSPWEQTLQTVVETEAPQSGRDEATSSSDGAMHHRQRSASETTIGSYKPCQRPTAEDRQGHLPSKPYKLHGDNAANPPRALSTRSSAFFGSPTCHLFRTTSPYRKVLQEKVKSESEAPAAAQLLSPSVSMLNLDIIPTRRRPSLSKEDPRLAYSESIYSDDILSPRTIPKGLGEQTEPTVPPRHPNHKAADPDHQQTPSTSDNSQAVAKKNSSDTTPLTDVHQKRYLSGGPHTYTPTTPQGRTVSNASSVEWKTWLSANAANTDAKLANTETQHLTEVRYAKPSIPRSLGHVRERAEIEDSESPALYAATGTGKTKFQTPLRVTSHNPRQVSSTSRIELGIDDSKFSTPFRDENTIPKTDGRVTRRLRGIYNPPPIPPRSSLRTTPSMPLMQPRLSHSNLPVMSVDKKASKVRSLDVIPKAQNLVAPLPPKTRSPVKLVRRTGLQKGLQSSASSPGLTMAVEKQFGPMLASQQFNRGSPRERRGSVRRLLDSDSRDDERSDNTSLDDWKAEAAGSHHMVENFLSSRRRPSVHGAFL